MGNPFVSPSIAGYNANPPTDDGANTANNEVKWSKHKDKLADPVKTLTEQTITNTDVAFAKIIGGAGVRETAVSFTVQTTDQGKLIRATASGITITTPDATSVLAPFVFDIVNDSGGNITFDGNGTQTINGDETVTIPDKRGGQVFTDGSNWFFAGRNFDVTPELPRSYIGGLQLVSAADAAHDITIAIGEARGAADDGNLALSTSMTKQIDATWAVGDNVGGMANGVSLDIDIWYHLFLVDDGSGGTDAGFDTDIDATNLLATTGVGTIYRRIGSVLTDGSSNILAFSQAGDEFLWADPTLDVSDATAGTAAETGTLATPLGLKVTAIINCLRSPSDSGDDLVYISSPDVNDEASSATSAPLASSANEADDVGGSTGRYGWTMRVRTGTSSDIRYRTNDSDDLRIATLGWIDPLGRWD